MVVTRRVLGNTHGKEATTSTRRPRQTETASGTFLPCLAHGTGPNKEPTCTLPALSCLPASGLARVWWTRRSTSCTASAASSGDGRGERRAAEQCCVARQPGACAPGGRALGHDGGRQRWRRRGWRRRRGHWCTSTDRAAHQSSKARPRRAHAGQAGWAPEGGSQLLLLGIDKLMWA